MGQTEGSVRHIEKTAMNGVTARRIRPRLRVGVPIASVGVATPAVPTVDDPARIGAELAKCKTPDLSPTPHPLSAAVTSTPPAPDVKSPSHESAQSAPDTKSTTFPNPIYQSTNQSFALPYPHLVQSKPTAQYARSAPDAKSPMSAIYQPYAHYVEFTPHARAVKNLMYLQAAPTTQYARSAPAFQLSSASPVSVPCRCGECTQRMGVAAPCRCHECTRMIGVVVDASDGEDAGHMVTVTSPQIARPSKSNGISVPLVSSKAGAFGQGSPKSARAISPPTHSPWAHWNPPTHLVASVQTTAAAAHQSTAAAAHQSTAAAAHQSTFQSK